MEMHSFYTKLYICTNLLQQTVSHISDGMANYNIVLLLYLLYIYAYGNQVIPDMSKEIYLQMVRAQRKSQPLTSKWNEIKWHNNNNSTSKRNNACR